jgi:hypothetical protein
MYLLFIQYLMVKRAGIGGSHYFQENIDRWI